MEEHITFIHAEIVPTGVKPTMPDIPAFHLGMLKGEIDTVVTKCVLFFLLLLHSSTERC